MKTEDLLTSLYGSRCKTTAEYASFLNEKYEMLSKFPADKLTTVLDHKVPEDCMVVPAL
jgi:hypothetical protein